MLKAADGNTLSRRKRPNEYFPIEEDAHGTYIMNSKDLCMIEIYRAYASRSTIA